METINLYTENFFLNGRLKNAIKFFLNRGGSGPQILEANLIAGLKACGLGVELNAPIAGAGEKISVLREKKTFKYLAGGAKRKLLVGPNFTAADMAEIYSEHSNAVSYFLAPSNAVGATYEYYGVPKDRIKIWPVGIDTQYFPDVSNSVKSQDAVLYFKRRSPGELRQVIKLLENEGQTYTVLKYGHYTKEDFKQVLQASRYAVILDGTESQGIALQEIMSSNLPLFVFDQIYAGEAPNQYLREFLSPTTVPYWSESCGIKVPTDMFGQSKKYYISIPDSAGAFREFLNRQKNFSPRTFIVENLSLKKQAREFSALFN